MGLHSHEHTTSAVCIIHPFDVTRKCGWRQALFSEPLDIISFGTETNIPAGWHAEKSARQHLLFRNRIDADQAFDAYFQTDFFHYFSHYSIPRRLDSFHAATRKVPGIHVCAVAEQNSRFPVEDYSKGAETIHDRRC